MRNYIFIKKQNVIFGVIVFIALLFFFFIVTKYLSVNTNQYTIVIDPGHGGEKSKDKGATARDGTKESDLNDSVATKLYKSLKKEGYTVKYTRRPYINKEEFSLTKRTNIINTLKPDLVISIHHDSTGNKKRNKTGYSIYYSSYKKNLDNAGLYVQKGKKQYIFIKEKIINETTSVYYKENGKIQIAKGRNNVIVKDNTPCKVAKRSLSCAKYINGEMLKLPYINPLINTNGFPVIDNNFRLLRVSNYPSLLIECGVMSNNIELRKIKDEQNQKDLVYRITKGINNYFKTQRK